MSTSRLGVTCAVALAACSSAPHRPAPVNGVASPESDPSHVIAIGKSHACARTHAGTVMCWGLNEYGQLGDGTREDRYVPVEVPGLTDIAGVSAGREHTCAWTRAGAVSCWGGYGSDEPGRKRLKPTVVDGVSDVVEVVSGETGDCARSRDGRVHCFGFPAWSGAAPAAEIAELRDARELAVGKYTACAIRSAGDVGCWKLPLGPAGLLEGPVVSIPDVSIAHLDAVKDFNDDYIGTIAGGRYVQWSFPLGESVIPPAQVALPAAVRIAVGPQLGCAVVDEAVTCWDMDDDDAQHGTPRVVPGTAGALEVVVGDDPTEDRTTACARFADGRVTCWGPASQVGAGVRDTTAVAAEVVGIDDAVEIAGNDYADFMCARRRAGAVSCWGALREGRAGGSLGPFHPTPAEVGIDDATGLVADVGGGCATRRSGATTCFGSDALTPLALSGAGLALGWGEACVLDARGAVTCESDTPPDGEPPPDNDRRTVPPSVGKVQRLWLGYDTGCAIQRSGRLACWYRDQDSSHDTYSQRFVAAIAPAAVDVALGSDATCLVRPDGTVGCAAQEVPFGAVEDVTGITDAVDIASGFGGFCAVDRAGSVQCWSEVYRRKHEPPVNGALAALAPIEGLHDAVQLAGSMKSVCALRRSGHVACWGMRDQLGDGGTLAAGPVEVTGVRL